MRHDYSRLALLAALVLTAGALHAGAASAQATVSGPGATPLDPEFEPVPERRFGFTVGTTQGLLVGGAQGFPSDFDKNGVSEFNVNTGVTYGFGYPIWVGGALQDWFTFALGGTGVNLEGNGLVGSGTVFLIRLETVPLFTLGGVFRDLGVSANFGTGSVTIERDGKEKAAGKGLSVLGAGVFWEALRGAGFALGPAIEYTYMATANVTVHGGLFGLRAAYYSGI